MCHVCEMTGRGNQKNSDNFGNVLADTEKRQLRLPCFTSNARFLFERDSFEKSVWFQVLKGKQVYFSSLAR